MQNDDTFLGPQLHHRSLEFEGFVDPRLHKRLDRWFAESGKHTASKSTGKPLAAGKSHSISLVSRTVQDLDAFGSHHSHQVLFVAAFVIVVSKHCDRGYANAH